MIITYDSHRDRVFEITRDEYRVVELILGIGNDLLGDDGVGPYIAERLKIMDSSGWVVINAGIVPENFIRPMHTIKPDRIIIIDAVEMGLEPGTVRIIPAASIRDVGIGTHQLPLSFFISQCASISPVVLIGIQPGCLDMDTSLTLPVVRAAHDLISLLQAHQYDQLPILDGGKEKE